MNFSIFQTTKLAFGHSPKHFVLRNRRGRWVGILFLKAIFASSLAINVQSATYFIDYASGSDGNNGTSTATPFQRCPGMSGFSGAYSHAAGDVFLFKGGVTWPTTVFPLSIATGGTSGNNDFYGTTNTWFTGGSWTRPVFDLQLTALAGGINAAIYDTANYITVSSLEIKGLLIPNSSLHPNFGAASVYQGGRTTDLLVQNCYIHDWRAGVATNDAPNSDTDFGGIVGQGQNLLVYQCTIGNGQPPVGMTGDSGCGVDGAWEVVSNVFYQTPEFINGGPHLIAFNTFSNGLNSYDVNRHANVIFHGMFGNEIALIHDNIIHDMGSTFQTMLLAPGQGGSTNNTYYLYNNITWNVSSAIDIDQQSIVVSNSATVVHAWNNTLVGFTIGAINRSQPNLVTKLDCENNHFIFNTNSTTPNAILTANSGAGGAGFASVGTLIDSNNVTLSTSVALADGYTIANQFQPTSASSPTVGAGLNLTSAASAAGLPLSGILGVARTSTGAWDAGAYQVVTTAPFVSLTASPATVMNGQPTTLTWSSVNVTNLMLNDFGPIPLNGSTNFTPTKTTTYVMTATGTNGTRSATILIQMIPQPPSGLGIKSN